MNINLNFRNPFLWITLGLLLVILYLSQCSKTKQIEHDNTALVRALSDTVKLFKDKQGLLTGTIETLRTTRVKDIENITSKDSEIVSLKKVVKDYQDKLEVGSSVTKAVIDTKYEKGTPTTIVKIDTVRKDSIVYAYSTYYTEVDSTKNKWVQYQVLAAQDTTVVSIKIHNEFDAVVGYDKKAKKPVSILRLYNPYSEIKELRTYQVQMPPEKKWGISLIGGYGINDRLSPGFFVGAGLSYSVIRW